MSDHNLTLELWEVAKLIPYEHNAKKHPEGQIETLAKLIKRNGFTAPIVVDKNGVIIAGHGRRLAAIRLGYKTVPVICRRDLNEEEVAAARLADNKASSNIYDNDLLQAELEKLNSLGFDLELTGFSSKELEFLTSDIGEIDVSSFVDDIGLAVEEQKEANEKKAEEIDESTTPVAKAIGFSKVSVSEARRIRTFMNQLQAESGLEPVPALMHFLAGLGIKDE